MSRLRDLRSRYLLSFAQNISPINLAPKKALTYIYIYTYIYHFLIIIA